MARRNSKNSTPVVENTDSTATEAPAEVENIENTPAEENVVSESVTEEAVVQPEPATPAAVETPAAKPVKEIDLTDFQASVDAALEGKDNTTGEVAPAFINPVQESYRKLDGVKAKNKAKAVLDAGMKDAMNSMDIVVARAYMTLSDALVAVKSAAKADKVPTDPTEAFVERIVGLKLASALAAENVPEGVSGTWTDKANELFTQTSEAAHAYLAWTKRPAVEEGVEDVPEPETSNVAKAAVKLSLGKSVKMTSSKAKAGAGTGTPFEGTRRNIATHVVSAFDDVEAGTFLTVTQIRAKKSDEYGDDLPSAGAISIRLFPMNNGKMTIPGVTAAYSTDGKNNKGAIKL